MAYGMENFEINRCYKKLHHFHIFKNKNHFFSMLVATIFTTDFQISINPLRQKLFLKISVVMR